MDIVVTGEVWISQCCVCQKYFDPETRKRIDKPPESASIAHTYCDTCFDDAMTTLIPQADVTRIKSQAN